MKFNFNKMYCATLNIQCKISVVNKGLIGEIVVN